MSEYWEGLPNSSKRQLNKKLPQWEHVTILVRTYDRMR